MTTYIAKKAPPFCEIWFVAKGKLVWAKDASEFANSELTDFRSDTSVIGDSERYSLSSLQSPLSKATLHEEVRCSSLAMRDLAEEARNIVLNKIHDVEIAVSPSISSTVDTPNLCESRNSTSLASASSFFASPVDGRSMPSFSIQVIVGMISLLMDYNLQETPNQHDPIYVRIQLYK